MKDDKKIQYNLIVGILSQAIILVLGIIVPKLVLVNYGSEINGLLSSITNIYSYIAIVEAGVAAASCQALYKPIAENDFKKANSIISATNKYYHKTGIIYLALILVFSIIYPILINTEIPYYVVVLVILFNGFGNVVNYFFHGKYLIFLKADGKNFVRTGLETFTNVFKHASKIVFISLGFNVVMVQFIAMLASWLQMFFIYFYIKKRYSWIDLKATPDMGSISQSKYVFIHEINYLITSNVDTVVLTLFSDLKIVSVYSLYNLLFNTVNRVLCTIRDSFEFKIAYFFHKDKKVFSRMYEVFEIYYITFSFAIFTIMNYFVLPFLKLYTINVNDINYINIHLPVLFVIINLISAGRYPSEAMIHISGHFNETKHSAIIESLINILFSIVLVHYFGIVGVLLGTIFSSLYRTFYLILYVNKKIIFKKVKNTLFCWCANFILFVVVLFINKKLVYSFNSYFSMIIFCIPYAIIIFILYFLIISLLFPSAFKQVLAIVKNIIFRKSFNR